MIRVPENGKRLSELIVKNTKWDSRGKEVQSLESEELIDGSMTRHNQKVNS